MFVIEGCLVKFTLEPAALLLILMLPVNLLPYQGLKRFSCRHLWRLPNLGCVVVPQAGLCALLARDPLPIYYGLASILTWMLAFYTNSYRGLSSSVLRER